MHVHTEHANTNIFPQLEQIKKSIPSSCGFKSHYIAYLSKTHLSGLLESPRHISHNQHSTSVLFSHAFLLFLCFPSYLLFNLLSLSLPLFVCACFTFLPRSLSLLLYNETTGCSFKVSWLHKGRDTDSSHLVTYGGHTLFITGLRCVHFIFSPYIVLLTPVHFMLMEVQRR